MDYTKRNNKNIKSREHFFICSKEKRRRNR